MRKVKKKDYESFTLIGDCGKIIIYRQDTGDVHLVCNLKPKCDSGYHFNFNGDYKDQDTGVLYKLIVGVDIIGKHRINYSKKFIDGKYGSIRTETKNISEQYSYNMIEFTGDRFGVCVTVQIPQIALTHKYSAEQRSNGPRRLGHMMLHDKHGTQEVTSVVGGGKFSPK